MCELILIFGTILFAGWVSGSCIVYFIKSIYSDYKYKNYLMMILSTIGLVLSPFVFVIIIALAIVLSELAFIYATGQL